MTATLASLQLVAQHIQLRIHIVMPRSGLIRLFTIFCPLDCYLCFLITLNHGLSFLSF